MLEDIFLIKKYPEKFTFIVYQTNFTGTFEGFENPIVLIVTKKFDEIEFIRAFLVGQTIDIKLGIINEKQREYIIESFANYRYWLFKTFGEWPRKLYFLKDYDFSKNVWEWIRERTKDEEILKEIRKIK